MSWKVTESGKSMIRKSFKGCCNYPLYWCHTHRRSCTTIDKLTCQLATWAGVFSNPCRSRWFWMSKVLATRSMHHWPLRSGIVCHLWFDWVLGVGKDSGECKYGGLIQNNDLGDIKYQLVWFEWPIWFDIVQYTYYSENCAVICFNPVAIKDLSPKSTDIIGRSCCNQSVTIQSPASLTSLDVASRFFRNISLLPIWSKTLKWTKRTLGDAFKATFRWTFAPPFVCFGTATPPRPALPGASRSSCYQLWRFGDTGHGHVRRHVLSCPEMVPVCVNKCWACRALIFFLQVDWPQKKWHVLNDSKWPWDSPLASHLYW